MTEKGDRHHHHHFRLLLSTDRRNFLYMSKQYTPTCNKVAKTEREMQHLRKKATLIERAREIGQPWSSRSADHIAAVVQC